MSHLEHIARVEIVRRHEDGCYGVVITFADGTMRNPFEWWDTLGAALHSVAEHVAHELRHSKAERIRLGCSEVP